MNTFCNWSTKEYQMSNVWKRQTRSFDKSIWHIGKKERKFPLKVRRNTRGFGRRRRKGFLYRLTKYLQGHHTTSSSFSFELPKGQWTLEFNIGLREKSIFCVHRQLNVDIDIVLKVAWLGLVLPSFNPNFKKKSFVVGFLHAFIAVPA